MNTKSNNLTVAKAIAIEENRKGLEKDYEILMSDAAVMEGITVDQLKDLEIDDAKALVSKYNWIYSVLQDRSSKDSITVSGVEYKVLPIESIKFGQFMDLEDTLKSNKNTPYKAIPRMVALLVTDSKGLSTSAYNNEITFMENKIKAMELSEVVPVINFILQAVLGALESSPIYLAKLKEKQAVETLRGWMNKLTKAEVAMQVKRIGLGNSMVGMRSLTIWLIIRLIRSLKYLTLKLAAYSTSLSIK